MLPNSKFVNDIGLPKDVVLVFGNGDQCIELNYVKEVGWICSNIQDLVNNHHEEADTMIMLHMQYVTNIFSAGNRNDSELPTIYIRSVDTDVLVLTLAYCSLWQKFIL